MSSIADFGISRFWDLLPDWQKRQSIQSSWKIQLMKFVIPTKERTITIVSRKGAKSSIICKQSSIRHVIPAKEGTFADVSGKETKSQQYPQVGWPSCNPLVP